MQSHPSSRVRAGVLSLLAVTACGAPIAPIDDAVGLTTGALMTENGLSTNGLSTNGVSTNGLSTNGLSTNGLSANGLSPGGVAAGDFAGWFEANPVFGAIIMKYIVRCAYPYGQSLTYTAASGETYTWPGDLGLAPKWAAGVPIPVDEQELVSACIGAHINKFGVHVSISVRGFFADETSIEVSDWENKTYAEDEGCYFGNLFDADSGVFTGFSNDAKMKKSGYTSLRACAVSNGGPGSCPPMQPIPRQCQDACTDSVPGYFQFRRCLAPNGRSYRALSVRLLPTAVNLCGDKVCQESEDPTSCPLDCNSGSGQ